MGAPAWGTLDDKPGCDQTTGETDQIDRTLEVSPIRDSTCDSGRASCFELVHLLSLFGSLGVMNVEGFLPSEDQTPVFHPDSSSVAGAARSHPIH